MTIPATITGDLNATYGPNATITASLDASIDASGTVQGSDPVTINFAAVTVPASGSFLFTGIPTTTTFTGTGANVTVTPGVAITTFDISVNGTSMGGFSCTIPTPGPVIAYAEASNGPFAYVANAGSASVTPFSTADDAAGSAIGVGSDPDAVAVSPDGSTVWVANEDRARSPRSRRPPTRPAPRSTSGRIRRPSPSPRTVRRSGWPTAARTRSPRSSRAPTRPAPRSRSGPIRTPSPSPRTVRRSTWRTEDRTRSPRSPTAADAAGTPIDVGSDPYALAVSPDGSTVWVANGGSDTVQPIPTDTDVAGTPITVGSDPDAVAVSPDGSTVYVADFLSNAVTPISTSDRHRRHPIGAGSEPAGIAVSPDGSTVYVADFGVAEVTPISTVRRHRRHPIGVRDPARDAIAIAPDQGPTASLSSSTTGSTTTFDASASVPGTSPIASYSWNFGDPASGSADTEVTGSGEPSVSHTYTAGACNGTPVSSPACIGVVRCPMRRARRPPRSSPDRRPASTAPVRPRRRRRSSSPWPIAPPTTSATTPSHTPASDGTPSQSVTVTIPAAGSASGAVTLTSGPGQLVCSAKGFTVTSSVTSYSATFTPSTDVR